jgi:hypothetical protein
MGTIFVLDSERQRLREVSRACDSALARLRAYGEPESMPLVRHIERTRDEAAQRLAATRPEPASGTRNVLVNTQPAAARASPSSQGLRD